MSFAYIPKKESSYLELKMNWPAWLVGTVERRSPSDIIPDNNIWVDNDAHTITIRYTALNIPFTTPPIIKPIMGIPNTNSMDGYLDYGNNLLYIEPANPRDHQIMCDWLALEIMANPGDDPNDFTKPQLMYAIHRILNMGYDKIGRWWHFKGINNGSRDNYLVRDKNILWLNTGIID
jgi:hypothetical protein